MNGDIQEVRSVVERARSGDQVAMALITEVGKQAKTGNKKARKSAQLIQRYITANPASDMAGEADLSVNTNPQAQLAIWKAQKAKPDVFASTVAKAAPYVGPWALIVAIFHGPLLKKGAPLMVAAATPNSKIATCVRRAYKLQRLADPKVPISSYCRETAIELGE